MDVVDITHSKFSVSLQLGMIIKEKKDVYDE